MLQTTAGGERPSPGADQLAVDLQGVHVVFDETRALDGFDLQVRTLVFGGIAVWRYTRT
jgi:hypothetical protein